MKKKFKLSIILIMLLIQSINAQNSIKKQVTWMGLDFTEAKLFPSVAFTNPSVIRDTYLEKWNQIILSEPTKYNIASYFDIDSLDYDLNVVKKRNLAIVLENLVVDKSNYILNEENIRSIIRQFPIGEGIGLVLVVESFNKNNSTGTYWATFFNRSTLELISTKKIKGKASGIGIRNFWANSLYLALKSYKG